MSQKESPSAHERSLDGESSWQHDVEMSALTGCCNCCSRLSESSPNIRSLRHEACDQVDRPVCFAAVRQDCRRPV